MGFLFDLEDIFTDIGFAIEDAVDDFCDNVSKGVNVLFCDPEDEGKKAGYDRAAGEYAKVFDELKREHQKIMDQIKAQRNNYNAKNDALIERLEQLEKKRDQLKIKAHNKEESVSKKYDIPIETVHSSAVTGDIFGGGLFTVNIFELVYNYKKDKYMKAKHEGYLEARKLYVEKIKKLKQELRDEKQKGYTQIQNLIDMMSEVFEEISNVQLEIVGLELLL